MQHFKLECFIMVVLTFLLRFVYFLGFVILKVALVV